MANDSFLIKAYAKINWALNVLSRRSDGYHILDMLVQRIDLADELVFGHADNLQLEVTNAPAGLDTQQPGDEGRVGFKAGHSVSWRRRMTLKRGFPHRLGWAAAARRSSGLVG